MGWNHSDQISEEKIDIVYLWCDGNESAFRERKNLYIQNAVVNDKSAGERRYVDNDELKYSLRSLEMYAPWINHVYIVTDRQVPQWLNTDYDKVTIVDHSEIMPQEIIPVFNSVIIEYFLPFIPNLSEKFLYANDDMFFGSAISPDYFFHQNRPIVRLRKSMSVSRKNDIASKSVRVAMRLLESTYQRVEWYRLHHNIDSYSKSAFIDTLKRYHDIFEATYGNRFRTEHDVHRIIFGLDAVYANKADLQIVKPPNFFERNVLSHFKSLKWESIIGNEGKKTRQNILKYKPKLFCINSNADNSERENSKRFLETLFPHPSKFEK